MNLAGRSLYRELPVGPMLGIRRHGVPRLDSA